jgi:signal transduction histidine kinase
VEKEIALLQQPIEEKELRLDNRIPAALIKTTDENFLTVILRNLLQNAVKYTTAKGLITLRADDGCIYICNAPAGARAEELNRRLQSRQVDSKGSGLGLQIAADLAARINARISFRQEGNDMLTAVLDLQG